MPHLLLPTASTHCKASSFPSLLKLSLGSSTGYEKDYRIDNLTFVTRLKSPARPSLLSV